MVHIEHFRRFVKRNWAIHFMTLAMMALPLNTEATPRYDSAYGGTLVWGVAQQPTLINPVLTQTSISASLIPLIFDSLVRINSSGEIEAGLAQSWEVSADQLTYTFHLIKGIEFHDGVELTAEDVLFTYELMNSADNDSVFRSHFEHVERFEAPNKYTFRVVLKQPVIPFMYKMVRYIVPKHLLEGEDIREAAFNYEPVGTGPFRFEEWNWESGQIELSANEHYFEGRPYLEHLVIKTYGSDSQLWSAIMRHEVDFVEWVTSDDYAILERDPAFKTFAVVGGYYYAIAYNLDDSLLQDSEIRRAIAYSVDRWEILDALPRVGGQVSAGPFHPSAIGNNPEVAPIEYDPEKANAILEQQGWKMVRSEDSGNHISIREKDGHSLELRMLVDERSDTYKKMAKVIRQQLAEVGIKVTVISYQDQLQLNEAFLNERKPQAWLRFFSGLGNDPSETLDSWYSRSSKSSKLWNYHNTEVDRLLQLGETTQTLTERAKIYQKIHQIIYRDQPACFLFFPEGYFAISADFEHIEDFFTLFMPVYTIKDWRIRRN